MAQQDINIGAANEGNGDTLFDAFTKVQANFDELYSDDAGDVNSVTAGNGLTGTATTGAITINAVGGDGITANADELEVAVDDSTIELSASDGSGTVRVKDGGITNAKLADDAVDHDELAARYTAKQEISTTIGAISIDWSSYSTFEFTASLTGGIELDFTGFKQGQVIDIYGLTGSQTITLDSDAATTENFYKVGGVDYDGSSNNLIQIVCTDDSANAEFHYSVATYSATDTTP